jgi:hypothetical protein
MAADSASVGRLRYVATGSVRAGGEGRLDAHGLAAACDVTGEVEAASSEGAQ